MVAFEVGGGENISGSSACIPHIYVSGKRPLALDAVYLVQLRNRAKGGSLPNITILPVNVAKAVAAVGQETERLRGAFQKHL